MRLKPTSEIKADLGIEPNGRVQKYFVDLCAKYMDRYIPMRPGNIGGKLRGTTHKTSNSITYLMPYAHAQYIGYTKGPVKNYSTPGTGPYWDKRMVSIHMNEIVQKVQQKILRGD